MLDAREHDERDHGNLQPFQGGEGTTQARPRGGERESMNKEERDALYRKCMRGLLCHESSEGALCSSCPYFQKSNNCDGLLCTDVLTLLREQPDDQPRETPNPFNITIRPEPNPLNVEIIGARIRGKYAKIGITPDELEIQIPGVIAPAELPALVDEFNRVLAFARQNKMTEGENE